VPSVDWRGDLRHFLKKHRKALRQTPFWVFGSGPVGDPTNDNSEWLESPKIAEKVRGAGRQGPRRLRRLPAGGTERFHGAGDDRGHPGYRDRRDWTQIRDWARRIAAALAAAPV